MNDRVALHVWIEALQLDRRGPIRGAEDLNLIRFSLIYPTEDVPRVESIKLLRANADWPTDWASDLERSIVFKTWMSGRARLKIEVFSVDRASAAEQAVLKLFQQLTPMALASWSGGLSNLLIGAVGDAMGSALGEVVGLRDDTDLIGAAHVDLDAQRLPALVELPLKVDSPVLIKDESTAAPVGHPGTRRRRRTMREAVPVGDNGLLRLRLWHSSPI